MSVKVVEDVVLEEGGVHEAVFGLMHLVSPIKCLFRPRQQGCRVVIDAYLFCLVNSFTRLAVKSSCC